MKKKLVGTQENPARVVGDENEETLAASDDCISDVELHTYQDALVRKGLEEMRSGRLVSHEEVVKRLRP
jgi:predicted transcriptional regulator